MKHRRARKDDSPHLLRYALVVEIHKVLIVLAESDDAAALERHRAVEQAAGRVEPMSIVIQHNLVETVPETG